MYRSRATVQDEKSIARELIPALLMIAVINKVESDIFYFAIYLSSCSIISFHALHGKITQD
jgi:hypothetical protein